MLKVNSRNSYKIGVDEIEGLKDAMHSVLMPVKEALTNFVYWHEVELVDTEYKSRDGFMAYSSNCGGVEVCEIIPKSHEYNTGFLDFGECDQCGVHTDANGEPLQCGYEGKECGSESEGHLLDAKLRVWLKFEGLTDGVMHFYLVLSGGNGDAPYFREKYSQTYFETEFEAKSLAELKRVGAKAVKKLLKVMD